MRTLNFTVPQECDGTTVGKFLRYTCKVSARLVTKQKQYPIGITNNGIHTRTVDIVRQGDIISLNIPDDVRPAVPSDLFVPVVYEDEDIVIMNKPPNMPVHPTHGHGDDTLANAYAAHLARRGEAATFRPINRLDKDTTGLVVICKNSHSASLLHQDMQKIYYAVCEGSLSGSGTIDAPIRRRENAGIRREIGEGGQRSVTHWKALCCEQGLTLLKIRLETGRTHQIRTHFADGMNMPLVGDEMYGGHTDLMPHQALHCGRVGLVHPITREYISVYANMPEDMSKLPPCADYSDLSKELFE